MISSGPRSGFLVSTFASVHGLRLAAAAWNSGSPGRGHRVGLVQLPWPRPRSRRWRTRSGTGRRSAARRGCGWPGCASTGEPTCSAEIGSGSTPRNGAGSIATDAADRPRPARIWVSSPPKEWPMTAGFRSSRRMTVVEVVGDLRRPTCRRRPRDARWPPRRSRGRPASPASARCSRPPRRRVAQRSQLLGSSHRPWTKTTGVRPVAFARSTCSASCSVMRRRGRVGGHGESSCVGGRSGLRP